MRTESAAEAGRIDERIDRAWESHPRRFVVDASADYLTKAARAIALLRDEMPECCRHHVVAFLGEKPGADSTAAATRVS